jgi:type VI secretion system protein ImpJ
MGWNNKVTWNEGLLLQPQHFQQQERFLESQVQQLTVNTRMFHWGFTRLVVNQDQLAVGKLVIEQASGVLPDGTPFTCPDVEPLPASIDIPENAHASRIYLAAMIRRNGAAEIPCGTGATDRTRYRMAEETINDVVTDPKNTVSIQQSTLHLELLRDDQPRADYSCLGVVEIRERHADGRVSVDDEFIPPLLDVQVSTRLNSLVQSTGKQLDHRANLLAQRLVGTPNSGAGVAELLQLWQLNRVDPLIRHFSSIPNLHPESLYRVLVSLAGELSSFNAYDRRPETFPPYRHDELNETFAPVFRSLTTSLNTIIDQPAQAIPLEPFKFGISKAQTVEPALLEGADFYLLVKADMPLEELRTRFVAQSKVGSAENIRDMVIAAIPGIELVLQPVKPNGVTPGYQLYFRLDDQSSWWPDADQPHSFAIHVGADFPGLDIELWAIRRSNA